MRIGKSERANAFVLVSINLPRNLHTAEREREKEREGEYKIWSLEQQDECRFFPLTLFLVRIYTTKRMYWGRVNVPYYNWALNKVEIEIVG